MKRLIYASEAVDTQDVIDVFHTPLYRLRRMLQSVQLPQHLLGGYCIYTTHFKQYAPGITGSNYYAHLYLQDDGSGWKFKKKRCNASS